jgi:hypothetical protein
MLLGCEESDDSFEARVAAQRIPKREQLQFAISDRTREANGGAKLIAREIVIANPRSNQREVLDHTPPTDCIFFNRKQLNRAPSFAQRFLFSAQAGIDQAKHA